MPVKNEKKEKVSSTKVKFSQFIEKQEVQKETFSTVGFPPEISTMSIEEAAIFL